MRIYKPVCVIYGVFYGIITFGNEKLSNFINNSTNSCYIIAGPCKFMHFCIPQQSHQFLLLVVIAEMGIQIYVTATNKTIV